MYQFSQTVWVYRENYPAKRFLGADAKLKAREFALDLSRRYPGSTISAKLETQTVEDLFKYEPTKIGTVKETNDA